MSVRETGKKILRPFYFRTLAKKADYRHTPLGLSRASEEPPGHVLVICIDALRSDFEPDLPLEFGEAIAPSTWTFPSVTSLLTGEYPHKHGATAHTMPEDDTYAMPTQTAPSVTLPELFESGGYDTLGLFGFPTPFMAARRWFQRHRCWSDASAETVLSTYQTWKSKRSRTFAYVHLGDLHAPLDPPESYVERHNVDTNLDSLPRIVKYTDTYDGSPKCEYYREHRLRLYRAALDYVEDALEPILGSASDDTVVVVTGDHGEAHWEQYEVDQQFTDSRPNYGVGHGGTPLDKVVRIPVGSNVDSLVPEGGWASLIDILPSFGQYAFGERIGDGEPWDEPIPTERSAICEGVRYGPERKAVYQGEKKLIHSKVDDVTLTAAVTPEGEDFDAAVDPEPLLDYLPNDWSEKVGEEVSAMVQDQLEALGYK